MLLVRPTPHDQCWWTESKSSCKLGFKVEKRAIGVTLVILDCGGCPDIVGLQLSRPQLEWSDLPEVHLLARPGAVLELQKASNIRSGFYDPPDCQTVPHVYNWMLLWLLLSFHDVFCVFPVNLVMGAPKFHPINQRAFSHPGLGAAGGYQRRNVKSRLVLAASSHPNQLRHLPISWSPPKTGQINRVL